MNYVEHNVHFPAREELEKIKRAAEKADVSVSRYIRRAALKAADEDLRGKKKARA